MTTTKVLRKGDGKQRLERHLRASLVGMFYSIEVFENPEPRQSLEEFVAEKNANSEYDPATERSLTVNGFAGKEYSSRNKTSPAMVQFFATEKRLFRFVAGGPPQSRLDVKQFFSSIKLGQQTDGIEVSDGPGTHLPDTGERIFTGREVDQKARLLTKPEPHYTEAARREGITGVVVLKVIFSATGEVNYIRVVSGLPHGLTEQAIKAAKKIKFIPAMKDGKAVSMWIQLEYNFNP
jgi:TonB family protein